MLGNFVIHYKSVKHLPMCWECQLWLYVAASICNPHVILWATSLNVVNLPYIGQLLGWEDAITLSTNTFTGEKVQKAKSSRMSWVVNKQVFKLRNGMRETHQSDSKVVLWRGYCRIGAEQGQDVSALN